PRAKAQESGNGNGCEAESEACNIRELATMVRMLKQQVASLSSELAELRAEPKGQPSSRAETLATGGQGYGLSATNKQAPARPGSLPSPNLRGEGSEAQTLENRVSQLEENQQLTANNLSELSQTKIE